MTPSIYADFHNADALGRLRLNCAGTARDLAAAGVRLADGEVRFSEDERAWVAVIDWGRIRGK